MSTKTASKINEQPIIRDRFQVDEAFETKLAFPCCVCLHRHGSDRDEPFIRCINNLAAELA